MRDLLLNNLFAHTNSLTNIHTSYAQILMIFTSRSIRSAESDLLMVHVHMMTSYPLTDHLFGSLILFKHFMCNIKDNVDEEEIWFFKAF